MFCCFQYAVGLDVATCCGKNRTHDFGAACSSSAGGSLEHLGLLLQQEKSSATGMKAILSLTTHKSMPYISPFGTL